MHLLVHRRFTSKTQKVDHLMGSAPIRPHVCGTSRPSDGVLLLIESTFEKPSMNGGGIRNYSVGWPVRKLTSHTGPTQEESIAKKGCKRTLCLLCRATVGERTSPMYTIDIQAPMGEARVIKWS